MKRLLLCLGLCFFSSYAFAQLSVTAVDQIFEITFDATLSGVSNGQFNGSGFQSTPTAGQLDSDAWAITGLSDGDLAFGGTGTSGDLARGSSNGGVVTGGLYAFQVLSSDYALGLQPIGSDFTPGTITLRVANNTGSTVTRAFISYEIYELNDQGRANSLNFSYSTNGTDFTDVTEVNYTTAEADGGGSDFLNDGDATKMVVVLDGLSIANGSNIELRWTGDDDSGGGSRDEYAIDDIRVSMNHNGGVITGNAGWRLLNIPLVNGNLADITDDGAAVQGVSDSFPSESDNVFTYDNSGSFEEIASTTTSLDVAYGFAMYFFDNNDAGSNELPIVLEVAGQSSRDDANWSRTLNTTNAVSGAYFTLVGNPFAGNFNIAQITASSSTIDDIAQFWNGSSYDLVDRADIPVPIVAPFQGFWISRSVATSTATSVNFGLGVTTANANTEYFSKSNSDRFNIDFNLEGEGYIDNALKLSFRDYATLGNDRADASKLASLNSVYASISFVGEFNNEDRLKAVESLPTDLDEVYTVDMRPSFVGVSGEFTLSWDGMEDLPNDWTLSLTDYVTGESVNMNEVNSYIFTSDQTAQPKSSTVIKPIIAESVSDEAANRFGITITPGSAVSNEGEENVDTFTLEQNFPNPFNPSTNIQYTLDQAGPVRLEVYNMIGQRVASLVNRTQNAGTYQISWNAAGNASGVYFYRLESAGQSITRQMTLIK